MKKLLWTVAALAALSFAVVGCNQNTDDATKTDTTTGSTTTGSTTTGTDANKTDGTTTTTTTPTDTTTTTTTTTPTDSTTTTTPAETTTTTKYLIENEKKTFTNAIENWGQGGSIQVDLPEAITVAEGDVILVSGTFEFGTPTGSGINKQFYVQDCIGYDGDYNMITDYTNGLAGQTKTLENHEWKLSAKSAGEWTKIRIGLGWVDGADGDTCDVTIKNFTVTKK